MTAAAREQTWTVTELAEEFEVTTRTLRHYEAEGLISPERRGSTRIYHPRDHARLKLVLRGRRFGMSLPEVREIVDMYDGAASSERRQLQVLLDRLATIDADLRERRRDIGRIIDEVGTVATQCRTRLDELGGPVS